MENKDTIDTSIFDKKEDTEQEKEIKEEQEETKEQENQQKDDFKTDTAPNLENMIKDIKAEYQAKIERLKAQNDEALEERDRVIKQLLKEEDTAHPLSIVDKINAKRNYKKW